MNTTEHDTQTTNELVLKNITQQGAVTKVYLAGEHGASKWFLLRSDAHHDSKHCRRDLEKKHLEEAKTRNALIIDTGDLFDAMQGRHDPRRSYDDLRDEYRGDDYYSRIVSDAAEFYKPYAKNWLLLAKGNHETGVLKNTNIDLTSQLAHELKSAGAKLVTGGFGGWVVLYLEHSSGGGRRSVKLKYYHGAGGNAPVTRGVIQTARQAVYLPDADVIVNGHNHEHYVLSIKRERITNQGRQYYDIAYFVRTPGYKDEYADGTRGWAVERGAAPKPLGAAWMRVVYLVDKVRVDIISDIE